MTSSSRGINKYAQQLQSFGKPVTPAPNDHELDADEEKAGRKRKRHRGGLVTERLAPKLSDPVAERNVSQINDNPRISTAIQYRSGPATSLVPPEGATTVGRGRRAREESVLNALNTAVTAPRSKSLDSRLAITGPSSIGASTAAGVSGMEQEVPDEEMADHSGSGSGSESDDEDEDNQARAANEQRKVQKLVRKLYQGDKYTSVYKPILDLLEEALEKEKRKASKCGATAQNSEPWDQEEGYLCTSGRKRRDKWRTALAGYVRHVVLSFMSRKNHKDPLPAGPPPEVAAPTANAFYIKWDENEKSLFNATAARIVTIQVIKDWPALFSDNSDEVFDMATLHIKYLRTCYRRQNDPISASEQARHRRCNADTRKRTLYEHRLRVINAVPALRKHGRLIEALGIEGTSSDEEDATRKGVYVAHRCKELSRQVDYLKRQLDLAYELHFKGPGSKGNQVRKRVDNGVFSQRKFRIRGIPLCCVDEGWLITLTDVQKSLYDFVGFDYDFDFPKELLESVN